MVVSDIYVIIGNDAGIFAKRHDSCLRTDVANFPFLEICMCSLMRFKDFSYSLYVRSTEKLVLLTSSHRLYGSSPRLRFPLGKLYPGGLESSFLVHLHSSAAGKEPS